jgi:cephalosporin hydroxylase
MNRLLAEYRSIPDGAWRTSYWEVHCSVGTLLLRGGKSGDRSAFACTDVHDSPVLSDLPAIRELLSTDGPFGEARYAYIFRMAADGIALEHVDETDVWRDMFRIHVPLITNSGSFLVANGKSMHFGAGAAWTFDNGARHGAVNGPAERVHLIFDVPFSEKLAARLDAAQWLEGDDIPSHVDAIRAWGRARVPYPGDHQVATLVASLRSLGINPERMAAGLNAMGLPVKAWRGAEGEPEKPWTEDLIAAVEDPPPRKSAPPPPKASAAKQAIDDKIIVAANKIYFRSGVFKDTKWMGVDALKCPTDMWVYQELIYSLEPDLIIETGTYRGGSALYFAQLLESIGKGQVVTVDIKGEDEFPGRPAHPRIRYVTGSSIDPSVVNTVTSIARDAGTVMVILDSAHESEFKLKELRLYSALVTEGSFIIAEDTCFDGYPAWPEFGPGPAAAVARFLEGNPDFEAVRECEKHMITFSPGAFLRRIR